MKRIVKIKALPVFIAWCVIFAHSIIPHYHLEDHDPGCHKIFHSIFLENENKPGFRSLSPNSNSSVCHFPGLVFHNLYTDTLFYPGITGNILILLNTQKIIFSEKSERFISDAGLGSNSLRAPPSA